MKRVDRYVTDDGHEFASLTRAEHHAEERLGAAITDLARRMLLADKYPKAIEFIEKNLDDFVRLKRLQEDIKLEPEPDVGD